MSWTGRSVLASEDSRWREHFHRTLIKTTLLAATPASSYEEITRRSRPPRDCGSRRMPHRGLGRSAARSP